MKEPLLNSHIFQITRRAANYLKADQLLGERMELWGTRFPIQALPSVHGPFPSPRSVTAAPLPAIPGTTGKSCAPRWHRAQRMQEMRPTPWRRSDGYSDA